MNLGWGRLGGGAAVLLPLSLSLCVSLFVNPPSLYLSSLHLFLYYLCLFSFPTEETNTGV